MIQRVSSAGFADSPIIVHEMTVKLFTFKSKIIILINIYVHVKHTVCIYVDKQHCDSEIGSGERKFWTFLSVTFSSKLF